MKPKNTHKKGYFIWPSTDPLASDIQDALKKLPKRLQTRKAVEHSIREFLRINPLK